MKKVLTLKGSVNSMAFLVVTASSDAFLYLVKNAETKEDALLAIVDDLKLSTTPEGKLQAMMEINKQQYRTFKYKFLRSVGIKNCSTMTITDLNYRLLEYFDALDWI